MTESAGRARLIAEWRKKADRYGDYDGHAIAFRLCADQLEAADALAGQEEAPQRKCVIGEYCSLHQFVHGSEAEELREHVESFIRENRRLRGSDLQAMLDAVDARDSDAFSIAKAEDDAPAPPRWQPIETAPNNEECLALSDPLDAFPPAPRETREEPR
jgi:hypothetical protein